MEPRVVRRSHGLRVVSWIGSVLGVAFVAFFLWFVTGTLLHERSHPQPNPAAAQAAWQKIMAKPQPWYWTYSIRGTLHGIGLTVMALGVIIGLKWRRTGAVMIFAAVASWYLVEWQRPPLFHAIFTPALITGAIYLLCALLRDRPKAESND